MYNKYKAYFIKYWRCRLLAAIGVLCLMMQTSCKKFIQVPSPTTQLVTVDVFNNSATATSAITNIYQEMYNNLESFNMAQSTGLMGDELINYSSAAYNNQLYTNSMTASPGLYGPWTNAYNYIYQANAIIEGVENNNAIASAIRQQLTGEGKFIRALWHFYLTNCYGDVPLVTSTSYKINSSLARSSKDLVYRQIIDDLKDAQNELNNNFVDASDTNTTTDRIRPNKWAATALLARAYLYLGKYDSAELSATAVINHTTLFRLTGLDSVFLANSNEAIWQLGIPLPNSLNTKDGYNFILQGAPGDALGQTQALSLQLISAFESGDNRKTIWVNYITTTAPDDTFYFPYKYKVYNSSAITEYTMMLRLGEQYLIRSEARVRQSDFIGGIEDLNTVRKRAGLPDYSGSSDQASLLKAVLHERQIELFSEWGHRWFDMTRTGDINSIMGAPGNVCQNKGGIWSSNWQLFPIPQTEIDNDPRLIQNLGY